MARRKAFLESDPDAATLRRTIVAALNSYEAALGGGEDELIALAEARQLLGQKINPDAYKVTEDDPLREEKMRAHREDPETIVRQIGSELVGHLNRDGLPTAQDQAVGENYETRLRFMDVASVSAVFDAPGSLPPEFGHDWRMGFIGSLRDRLGVDERLPPDMQ